MLLAESPQLCSRPDDYPSYWWSTVMFITKDLAPSFDLIAL
jgi:hypothetical protein